MENNDFSKKLAELARSMAREAREELPRHIAVRLLTDSRFAEWEHYRRNHPNWVPDLSDLNERACLEDSNLSGVDLSFANLNGANLLSANLSATNLYRAQIGEARLSWVNLSRADCRETNFFSSNLYQADLSNADLTDASFRFTVLTKANLTGATITGAFLYGASIDNWIIDNVKCDYIRPSEDYVSRLPDGRNFAPGEFEEYIRRRKTTDHLLSAQIAKGRETTKAFVSYVNEDFNAVRRMVQCLEEAGISIWWDKTNLAPGVRWQAGIADAIREGSYFIACFSTSYSSRLRSYMNAELRIAVEAMRQMPINRIWLIPVKLTACEIPQFDLGAGESLASLQWVDLSQDWKQGIQRLIDTVNGDSS